MKKTLTILLATIFSITIYSQKKNVAERLGYPMTLVYHILRMPHR